MKRSPNHAPTSRTTAGRRRFAGAAALLLTAGLATGLAACGDDEEDMDDVDVDLTSDTGMTPDSGMVPGDSTADTTMGTNTGSTPLSGSVSNDDVGTGTVAP